MDPITSFFTAAGKFIDLQIKLFDNLPLDKKEAASSRLFDASARILGWLDKGAAHIGIGPLAHDDKPAAAAEPVK